MTVVAAEAVSSEQRVRDSLAETYRAAALADLNMRAVAGLLETIRERLRGRTDWSTAWDVLNGAIVDSFNDDDLVGVLVACRNALTGALLADKTMGIAMLSSDEASRDWV